MMATSTTLKIDGSSVATMELQDRGLFGPPLGVALAGPMTTAGRRIWQSADGLVWTGMWSCTEGRFRTAFEGCDGEFIWIVAGRLTCVEDGGPTTNLVPGDAMLFPPGWIGEWQINGTLRKVVVGWTGEVAGRGRGWGPTTTNPMLGATEVAAMTLTEWETVSHEHADEKPSGQLGKTLWRSHSGSISVNLSERIAGASHADFRTHGELAHVVCGEVVCTPDDGSPAFTLRAEDAATYPRGWMGEWNARAPLRTLCVTWETW